MAKYAFDEVVDTNSSSGITGAVSDFGAGAWRGARRLIDSPAYLLEQLARKLGVPVDAVNTWAEKHLGTAPSAEAVNKLVQQAFSEGAGKSMSGQAGDIAGSIATAFVPGTGQLSAANKINQLWKAGSYGKALGGAAGLGAAQSSLLNTATDEDSLAGNALGGAVAGPAGQMLGSAVGRGVDTVRRGMAGAPGRVGRVLETATGMEPEALAQQIQRGNTQLTPGVRPTTTQAGMNPQLSQLERSVLNRGSHELTGALEAQNLQRIQNTERVARGNVFGSSMEAAENAGNVVGREAGLARDAARRVRRDLYNDPALEGALIPMPLRQDAKEVLEKYYPGRSLEMAPTELRQMFSMLPDSTNWTDILKPINEFDSLRKLAGSKARDFSRTDATAAKAMGDLKRLFDSSEAVAIKTDLPFMTPEQRQILTQARAAHQDMQERFATGPSRDMFRLGADGRPGKQGAEVPRAFFNPGSSQAADIQGFQKMLPGNEPASNAMRGYAITDLLERSGGADHGTLAPNAYNRWLRNRPEAIKGLLGADESAALQGVAADLRRARDAAKLGRGVGSNTAQNALGEGTLEAGMGGRGADAVAGFLPFGRAGLTALREAERSARTREVAESLIDPEKALEALRRQARLNRPNFMQRGASYGGLTLTPGMSGLLGD